MKNYGFPATLVILTLILISGNAVAQTVPIVGGDTGIYRIHGNVDGAKVYFDSDYKGEITDDILDVPVNISGTPYRTYTLQKEGYEIYTGTFTIVPAKDQVINIYATMSALPIEEYGTIHLMVTPTFSKVYFDGVEVGTVPPDGIFIVRNVPPGTHDIRISKEGYTAVNLEQDVGKNEIVKVPITLDASSIGAASLSVSSVPPGAQIYLDGEVMGVTPMTIPQITEGEHTLILGMEGYSDYTETVTIPQEGAVVSATLIPAPTLSGRIGLSPLALLGALIVAAFLVQKKT